METTKSLNRLKLGMKVIKRIFEKRLQKFMKLNNVLWG